MMWQWGHGMDKSSPGSGHQILIPFTHPIEEVGPGLKSFRITDLTDANQNRTSNLAVSILNFVLCVNPLTLC